MDMPLKSWTTDRFWQIALRDNGKCVYCDLDGALDWKVLANFCLDHLIPDFVGGRGTDGNLVLACRSCNSIKREYDPRKADGESREMLIANVRAMLADHKGLDYYRLLQKQLAGQRRGVSAGE